MSDELGPRFWSNVNKTDDCWLWTAYLNNGYGRPWHRGVQKYAHRLSWEAVNGPVPEGLDLDHLCRVRSCVNPAHLEPVTRQENMLRAPVRGPSARTHCPQGHPLEAGNLVLYDLKKRNRRSCLVCSRARTLLATRRYYARLRLERSGVR